MFDWLYTLFGWILKGCDFITGNYFVLAVIVFSLAIKILLFPLGIKQQKNSIRQAKLRPKEKAIRDKYKGRNDKPTQQKMNQEIMELYTSEKYNPLSGCLPLLIQLPLLIIVYNIIRNPNDYLGYTPNFNLFGADFQTVIWGDNGAGFMSWWIILPIITFVVYFFGAKITKKFTYNPQAEMGGDAKKSMAVMELSMPLLSVFISLSLPAAIGVYWIFSSIFGTLQQIILAKMYPLPVFTEEDYKKAALEMKGKFPDKPKNYTSKKKEGVYSLHHLDDDEDEEPVQKQPENKNAQQKKKGMASMIDRSEMKDDAKKEEAEETGKNGEESSGKE